MPQPSSVPVIPAQPNLDAYPIQRIALFTSYSRDTYRAAFGIEAPPYEPARLIKTWFDSTVNLTQPAALVNYKIATVDASGTWAIRPMSITVAEAAAVNLTGAVQYPSYLIAPTAASRAGSPLNPGYLSLESDAHSLMAQLGGTSLAMEEEPPFVTTYPPDEPRREWYFIVSGQPMNVGALLQARNAEGVGNPGHWELSSSGPIWVLDPAPTGLDDSRPSRDMPVRDLLPGEQFQNTLAGPVIVRSSSLQLPVPGFTAQDRDTLNQILTAVKKLTGA